ncbi:MAG: prepilin-type N-terminal cleavage/methylation domain-containing protein [Gammaproteobacteria bacterium]|nr:prepilin-type N-terminal cleavage/methylation domain-containing protein [Gammaproteobacteria bacterium]
MKNSIALSSTRKISGIRPRQQGFTLVEIMVALTIGLVMTAGILQISQANKASNRLVRNLSFVQENMRTAMELLKRDVRRAGFFAINGVPIPTPPPPLAATTVDGSENGAVNDNDTITVAYESDPRYFGGKDCLGQAPTIPAGTTKVRNTYFVKDEQLMCRGNGNARALSLVDGVEALQILYGENTDGDPRSANKYVRADQVTNMSNVVSVRIAMRFRSRANVSSTVNTNQYALLDEGASAVPNDRLLRREITTTISLRNTQ